MLSDLRRYKTHRNVGVNITNKLEPRNIGIKSHRANPADGDDITNDTELSDVGKFVYHFVNRISMFV